MMTNDTPLLEARGISKYFGHVVALEDISMDVRPGEVMCLLGDNGAGKSSLIKTFSGVHQPDKGTLLLEGKETVFNSPRDAIDRGIATVYQDLAMIPLSGISRNFFLGREPTKGVGPFKRFDVAKADRVTRDEPTSALGVKQAAIVLRYIAHAKEQGLGIIFISHNVYHAHPIGDRFTVLERGRSVGTFEKDEISIEELERQMAGGAELEELNAELQGNRPSGSEGSEGSANGKSD